MPVKRRSYGKQYPRKKSAQFSLGIERQDMGNMLVGADHDQSAARPIDPAQGKDILTAFKVGAEHLFIIAQAVAALGGT